MPKRQRSTVEAGNSSKRRARFLKERVFDCVEMRPCNNCSRRGLVCKTGDSSPKCSECIATGYACDLVVTAGDFDRADKEINRLDDEIEAANARAQLEHAKVQRLLKLRKLASRRKADLIRREFKNIEELEKDEREQEERRARDTSLLPLASEALGSSLVPDFDWAFPEGATAENGLEA